MAFLNVQLFAQINSILNLDTRGSTLSIVAGAGVSFNTLA